MQMSVPVPSVFCQKEAKRSPANCETPPLSAKSYFDFAETEIVLRHAKMYVIDILLVKINQAMLWEFDQKHERKCKKKKWICC